MAHADIAAQQGERLAAELRSARGEGSYHDHDVADRGAGRDLATAVEQTLGPIDVLVKRGRPGSRGWIVNVGSVAALVGLRGSIPHQASKAAVLGLTPGTAVRTDATTSGERDLLRSGRHPDDRERIASGG